MSDDKIYRISDMDIKRMFDEPGDRLSDRGSEFLDVTVEYFSNEQLEQVVFDNALEYYISKGHRYNKSYRLAARKAHDIVYKQQLHKKCNELEFMHWMTDKDLKSLYKSMITMHIDELCANDIDLNDVDLHTSTKDYISDMLPGMVELDIYELKETYRSRHVIYWGNDGRWESYLMGRVSHYQKVLDNLYSGMEIYKYIHNYKMKCINN